ncbi:MAG: hypothetical protein KDD56_00090 [Bdellovibrionales bacterium]|nr:hypothetical protein [Bdellovibrionales bacterium]
MRHIGRSEEFSGILDDLKKVTIEGTRLESAKKEYLETMTKIGAEIHKSIVKEICEGSKGKLINKVLATAPDVLDYIGSNYETWRIRILDNEDRGVLLFKTDVIDPESDKVMGTLEYVLFQRDLPARVLMVGEDLKEVDRKPRNLAVFFRPRKENLRTWWFDRITELSMQGAGSTESVHNFAKLNLALKGEEMVMAELRSQLTKVIKDFSTKIKKLVAKRTVENEKLESLLSQNGEDGQQQAA